MKLCCVLWLALVSCRSGLPTEVHGHQTVKPLIVVGSLNIDITVEVDRLPQKDETLTARSPSTDIAVGGKGANQAVAAARIATGSGRSVRFICQLGSDSHAHWLEGVLKENGVDVAGCGRSSKLPSGQGLVLLGTDGSATSVVVGGSNTDWASFQTRDFHQILRGAGAVLLQREIPEEVNAAVIAEAHAAGVPVLLDIGGEDRPISDNLLRQVDFLCPNEGELQRLTGMPTTTEEQVTDAVKHLQSRGARNVLVTLGARGARLYQHTVAEVLIQDSQPVPGGEVLDATAAGDAFRAAFAVALVEGLPLEQCLRLAAAAGAIAVSKRGAVPSLPTRAACEALLSGDSATNAATAESCTGSAAIPPSPMQFASRLNSMKARLDLWDGGSDTLGLLARQGKVTGLDLVYFNFPQHLEGLNPPAVLAALKAVGLRAGGVAMRFPDSMRLGAFTGPSKTLRRQAINMTIEGCLWARELGSDELVVWPQTDGYDYQLQVDFPAAWAQAVAAFREIADASACSGIKISLEFKPTDEISRFAIVPSTGAALLLVQEVNRSNLGLTLDVGHLLMAGENPGQSVAMVGSAGKLFGMHLNDGHSRLGAEDGLMFGSVHPLAALEIVFWLRKTSYMGSIYFDTFPLNEDPVKEAEFNIRRFKALWSRAEHLEASGLENLLTEHDAQGVQELLERLGLL